MSKGDEDLMGYITVMPIDKSKFKFAFRSTTTSTELVQQVCERAGIKQPQFFGLKRLRNTRSDLDEDAIPKIWMSEKVPLFTHGCDSSTTLFLRHKYWFYEIDEIIDPVTLQLIFEETDIKLMSGQFETNEDSNIQLAACRAQLIHGDFDKAKPITEEILKYLLPSYIRELHSVEEWGRLIGVFQEKLKGFTKEQVQKRYLVMARDFAAGIQNIYFPAQYSTKEMKSKVKILVGVNPSGIGFYTKDRKKLQVFHRFRDLQSWVVNPLWNGQEAPDYERPKPGDIAFETNPFAAGPFSSQLFIKTKSRRTKDIEIELNSFLTEDDSVVAFLDAYKFRLQQFISLMSLDDQMKDNFVQITTLEGVSKKIRISSEMTGQELIDAFAEKIGLKDTSFFQLSAVTDGCDKWIAHKESVLGQGVTSSTPLTLKLRFFWKNPTEVTDPIAKILYFAQVKEAVIAGDIPLTEQDAIELAGLFLQYTYGVFDKKKKYGFMNSGTLKNYIPFYLLDFRKTDWWVKKIVAAHEKASGMSKEDSLQKYLVIVSSLPNYGITYFAAIIPKTDEQCYVGVGKLGIALFKNENMELITSYRFGYELRSYSNDGEAIELHIKPSRHAEERTVIIVSLQFAEIIDMMSYYEKMRKFEKQINQYDGDA